RHSNNHSTKETRSSLTHSAAFSAVHNENGCCDQRACEQSDEHPKHGINTIVQPSLARCRHCCWQCGNKRIHVHPPAVQGQGRRCPRPEHGCTRQHARRP